MHKIAKMEPILSENACSIRITICCPVGDCGNKYSAMQRKITAQKQFPHLIAFRNLRAHCGIDHPEELKKAEWANCQAFMEHFFPKQLFIYEMYQQALKKSNKKTKPRKLNT